MRYCYVRFKTPCRDKIRSTVATLDIPIPCLGSASNGC